MYDSSYAAYGNPATGFLDSSMQSMIGSSSGGGILGDKFAAVMNSMTNSLTQGATQGMLPGMTNPYLPVNQQANGNQYVQQYPQQQPVQQGSAAPVIINQYVPAGKNGNKGLAGGIQTLGGLTPAQISQQMSTAGPLSILPYLGNSYLPQLVFPVAGLWSLYDGLRTMKSMRNDAALEKENHQGFDPNKLEYNQAVARFDAMRSSGAYGY